MEENWHNKRVLVTGGTGFIGSHLTDSLARCGATVLVTSTSLERTWRIETLLSSITLVQLRVEKAADVDHLFSEFQPDIVFHLGGQIRKKDISVETYTQVNVVGTQNVFIAAERHGTKSLVTLGSRNEYGSLSGALTEDRECEPLDAYGQSKLAATKFVLSQNSSVACTVVRPSSVYGTKQEARMFVPMCIKACITRIPFMTSPGEHTNNFLYVNDLVDALLHTSTRSGRPEIINIGSPIHNSFKEIAQKISEIYGDNTSVVIGGRPYADGEYQNTEFSTKKVSGLLGWTTQTSIDDGLKETVGWYLMNKNSPALI